MIDFSYSTGRAVAVMPGVFVCLGGWRSGGWAVFAGVLAGGATLMRPSWLLFTPFAVVLSLIVWVLRR